MGPEYLVAGGVALLGVLWKWFSSRHKKKAAQVRRWEQQIHAYADVAFQAVEILGAVSGWDGARKLLEAKNRVGAWMTANGAPMKLSALEKKIDMWACQWCDESMTDWDLQHAMEKAIPVVRARRLARGASTQ